MKHSTAETVTAMPVGPQACMPQELVASSVFLLARLGYSVKLQMIEEFEREGFSPYHYSVLALLEEGARETQGTIADALRLDRSQLVGLLDALEERGLVERRRDTNDRRRHVVSLTPAGRRQLAAFRKLVKRSEAEILAALDPDERTVLHGLLLRIAGKRDARFVPSEPAA
ncbi:MAG TPA: MarR family transcriptional regulator [Gaiellaceae bacterium]|jgi:DNA-binding MarR family transcriptional regulator|nr:MarR family transcriptional regulator [Gaiellaceae bacterium]